MPVIRVPVTVTFPSSIIVEAVTVADVLQVTDEVSQLTDAALLQVAVKLSHLAIMSLLFLLLLDHLHRQFLYLHVLNIHDVSYHRR